MADPPILRAPAPAKLNLYLHVVGRRDDGYHLLDTLFAFTALGDELAVEPAPTLALDIDGPFAAALDGASDNLVLRAARDLASGRGARLTLTKNLPVAAGLGGGSADAGAAIRLLLELWNLSPQAADLYDLSRKLGADVPACFACSPSFASGAGDVLTPAPALPPAGIVLVNPGAALRTPEIFAQRLGGFSQPARFDTMPATARELATVLRARRNDLTAGAVSLMPAIAVILAALDASEGCHLARMSGSGATCFGIYDDATSAARAAGSLRTRHPDWWIVATELLTR